MVLPALSVIVCSVLESVPADFPEEDIEPPEQMHPFNKNDEKNNNIMSSDSFLNAVIFCIPKTANAFYVYQLFKTNKIVFDNIVLVYIST